MAISLRGCWDGKKNNTILHIESPPFLFQRCTERGPLDIPQVLDFPDHLDHCTLNANSFPTPEYTAFHHQGSRADSAAWRLSIILCDISLVKRARTPNPGLFILSTRLRPCWPFPLGIIRGWWVGNSAGWTAIRRVRGRGVGRWVVLSRALSCTDGGWALPFETFWSPSIAWSTRQLTGHHVGGFKVRGRACAKEQLIEFDFNLTACRQLQTGSEANDQLLCGWCGWLRLRSNAWIVYPRICICVQIMDISWI